MRDKPDKNFRLEWPGGIVPEWARPNQNLNKRRGGKAARGASSKRERLQKVMAQSGYGSRRNIEILIAQGHITINGQVAKLGDSVGPGDRVKLDGKLISLRYGEPLPRVLLYHKPTGEIVTRDDPEERPTVFEKLPKVTGGRWVSVGRLDFNTEGLLIFTTNGDLANRLTHPRFEVEREYAVRLMGELTEEQKEKLLAGIDIEGELCRFDTIEDRGGEGSNHWYHVVLREGKNREVRRMMEAMGLMVSRLMRVRFGNVPLPAFLKRGQMRELDETQVHELLAFAGTDEPQEDTGDDAHVEDEHDNIGNRLADMPREPAATPEADDDYGNRIAHQAHQAREARESHRAQHEPDGNRITHHAAAPERPPKQGQQRRPNGGKPFAFGKKRGAQGHAGPGHAGQGPQGQGHAQGPAQGQGQAHAQGQGHAEGQGQGQGKHKQHRKSGQPRTPGGQGAGTRAHGQGPQPAGPPTPGAAQKPARNRRNKNRNRARGAQQGHGEQPPATNGNREPL